MTAWLPSLWKYVFEIASLTSFARNDVPRGTAKSAVIARRPKADEAIPHSVCATDFWRKPFLNSFLKHFLFAAVSLICIFSSPSAFANNLSISNVTVASRNTTAGTITIQFDISWSNSWRNNESFDAAWVFVKYSVSGVWSHATLKTSGFDPTGFSTGSGTALQHWVPTDKKGTFIQRSANGTGTTSNTGVKVVWDYAADGVSASSSVTLKVFGTEMIYIPQGGFYLGDNSSGGGAEFEFGGSTASVAGIVGSENAMTFANSSGTWYYNSGSNTGEDASGASFTVPAAFPKGYMATYMMKYEISEGQWVDFFNTLTAAQKTTRDITAASGKNSDSVVNRNTIAWTSGDATTTRADRAMQYLSWMDVCAFADWAALRPMSELEFEKAARGPVRPVAGEYVWGTTGITQCTTISGTENGTETCSSAGNANYGGNTYTGGDGGTGTLRVGIFAIEQATARETVGAGYYGTMNLSDNIAERAVTVGNATGRAFTATHGDGVLTTTSSYEGNATNTDWPGIDGTASRGVTGGTGSGYRGGSWRYSSSYMPISYRPLAASTDGGTSRVEGGRASRTGF